MKIMYDNNILALLESDDVVDNMLALYIFESNYDSMYESDEDDEKKEIEEAKKRKKEQRKKIAKIIAITTATIATCAAAILTVKKLKEKGVLSSSDADRMTKKLTDNKDRSEEIREQAKAYGNENLGEKDIKVISNMLDEAEKLRNKCNDDSDIKAGNIEADAYEMIRHGSKSANPESGWGTFGKAARDVAAGVLDRGKGLMKVSIKYEGRGKKFTITDDKDRSTQYGWLYVGSKRVQDSGLKLKDGDVVVMLSGDEYDRINDTILEKYNNDEIDAETCIALMERAAERYLD